jgi:hypothetical protein
VKKENDERFLLDRSAELLSEEQLKGLKDQLRTQILIPLFRAIGYQGLDHYHDPTERGKDIVMWLPTRTEGVKTTRWSSKQEKSTLKLQEKAAPEK